MPLSLAWSALMLAAAGLAPGTGVADPAQDTPAQDTPAQDTPTADASTPSAQREVVLYPDPAPPYETAPAAPGQTTPPPTTPRALTTLYGHPPSEVAKHTARRLPVTFTPDLAVRMRAGAVSEFSVDRLGTQYIEGVESTGRVRWRPVLGLGRREQVKITGMLDIANGRWAPSRASRPEIQAIIDAGQAPIPTRLRGVDPRELYLQWTSKAGQLSVGQMSFTWGQGLLSNDGNNMDRFGDLRFGDDGDGSIQERILLATRPLAPLGGPGKDIVVAVGADLVYRDANADLRAGDLAGQGLLVVRWQPEDRPDTWLGTYAVYRRQRNADDGDLVQGDDDLEIGVLDLAGQGFVQPAGKLALLGAFEAAAILGRTTFARGDREFHRVLQGGAALRAYLGRPETWLAGLDAGYASGDANPDDDTINEFSAAPGYTAGLLLFPYYQGWQSARSQQLAQDPGLSAIPRNGTQYIPTRGTVTNAVFVHPKARWSWQERFEVWGGPLLAMSAVPLVDPYASRLNGGDAVNALGGRPDGRSLGTELDLGIRTRYALGGAWLQAGLQSAVFFPGPAFVQGDLSVDKAVFGAWFRAEVRY